MTWKFFLIEEIIRQHSNAEMVWSYGDSPFIPKIWKAYQNNENKYSQALVTRFKTDGQLV